MNNKIQNTDLAVGQGRTVEGKHFELRNSANNEAMLEFTINYTREVIRDSYSHDDGSVSDKKVFLYVSDDAHGWFRVYGHDKDKNVFYG